MCSYKKIHYIWLGGGEKKDVFYTCYYSWKRFLPDWKIIEWNECNLNLSKYKYAQQAYNMKKYAFASDVFRFDIINNYHGVYFDTDVEIISPIETFLETYDSVTAFENKYYVNPGLILFSKNKNKFCNDMLTKYKSMYFYENENLKTICEYSTEYLLQHGLKQNSTIETINGITIFPKEYFCPFDYLKRGEIIPEQTKTIHHYAGSWLSKRVRVRIIIKKIIISLFGERIINFLINLKKGN